MARLFMSGFEIEASQAVSTSFPDGMRGGTNAAGVTRDTTVFRSGAASGKCDSGASTQTSQRSFPGAAANNTTYYARVYILTTAVPGFVSASVFFLGAGANEPCIRIKTDGTAVLSLVGVEQTQTVAVNVTDGAWHRLELSGSINASAQWTTAEARVDGSVIGTWTGTQAATAGNNMGWVQQAPGANKQIWLDDYALNDSTGTTNNNYPGDGKIVLLKPTADSAVGTGWTLGTGTAISGNSGKTAVSNTPPLGVADLAAGSNTEQIRNASSNANTNYDATMTTYTAAGVGASDTVSAVVPWVITAAPVVTSAKAGTVGVVSNPAIANVALGAGGTAGAFWSGTAGGTYSTGWKPSPGTIAQTPTVTRGTAPVMRITQVTASTQIATVCFMGIYVDYTPAVAAAVIPDVGMALTVT